MMIKPLFTAFLWLILSSAVLQANEPKPKYLEALDKSYRSGDWILQCDSSRICRIIGVVEKSGDESEMRAIVTISRGIEKNAKHYVRFAFIDDYGFVLPPPDEHARLYSRGQPKMPPPILLQLGAAEGDPAYPQYRVPSDQGWRIISAFRRWPGVVLRTRAAFLSHLPKGNLGKLLRKMDELQPALSSVLSADEQSKWMKEYNYIFVRVPPVKGLPTPDDVLLSCDTQTHVNSNEGWQLDQKTILWIAHCPGRARTFLQRRQMDPAVAMDEYGTLIDADVTDTKGVKRLVHDASFDSAVSILEMTIAKKGRWDCGIRLQYGYTKQGEFGVKEDRRMPICRQIPSAYWPLAWAPTSWRLQE